MCMHCTVRHPIFSHRMLIKTINCGHFVERGFEIYPDDLREPYVTMTSHGLHVVSNYRLFDWLFNRLCGPTSKKHQIHITGSVAPTHTKGQYMMTSSNGNIFRVTGHLWGIHQSRWIPRQWRGALTFSLICTRINGWVNNGEACDLRRNRAHYDVTEMNMEKDSIWWRYHVLNMTLSCVKDQHNAEMNKLYFISS